MNFHLIFEVLGYTLGYRYYVYLRKESIDLISDKDRLWILIGAAFGAFIGSRLVASFEDPSAWTDGRMNILTFFAGKTIVGGLLGGLAGVELTKKKIGVSTSSGDLMTYPLIIAMIIGRIGCFSMGIAEPTYGVETSLPWGIDLGDGLYRHPVAVYEMLFLGLIWLMLKRLNSVRELENGNTFKLFMITYLGFRFAIEFIKPVINTSVGLSGIQIACLAGLIYYLPTIRKILFSFHSLKTLA